MSNYKEITNNLIAALIVLLFVAFLVMLAFPIVLSTISYVEALLVVVTTRLLKTTVFS